MGRVGRSWRAFLSLSWAERLALLRTLFLLPLVVASLRLLGFRRTAALLVPAASSARPRTDLAAAQTLARIVHGAAPWSALPANCLPRALVLCRLLRRQGLQAELRLGVGKPDGQFAAHAWVEHDGHALAEPENSARAFAPLGGTSLTNRP
jgi:hypothetical protein